MQVKRVFLTVLDSVGIGASPDAAAFGDARADTMRRISASPCFAIPTLRALGIGNIDGLSYLGRVNAPTAAVARMQELSRGKDTTVGHFEIAGVISDAPLPTYPSGFPDEVLVSFVAATGRGVLCNRPYSGTDVIRDYGDAHVESGDLIVYTSADSVFQIAAHEDVVPTETLYEYCRIARRLLTGKHGVGRVIARPFRSENGQYVRTGNRRDFSIEPPRMTALDLIKAAGLDVIGVGKIGDIFGGMGITERIPTHGNTEGVFAMLETWYAQKKAADPTASFRLEQTAITKALKNRDALGMEGLVLTVKGKIIAMTLGSDFEAKKEEIKAAVKELTDKYPLY